MQHVGVILYLHVFTQAICTVVQVVCCNWYNISL